MIKKIWSRLSVTAQLSVVLVCFIAGIIITIKGIDYIYQKPLTEKRFERLMEINDIQQEDFISCEVEKNFPMTPWYVNVVYKSRPDVKYSYEYDWALIVTDNNCWPRISLIHKDGYETRLTRADAITSFEKGQNLIFPEN